MAHRRIHDKGSFTNYVSSWVGGGGLGADDANVLSMGLTSPNILTGWGEGVKKSNFHLT